MKGVKFPTFVESTSEDIQIGGTRNPPFRSSQYGSRSNVNSQRVGLSSSSSPSLQKHPRTSRFWKPGTVAPGVNVERSSGSEDALDVPLVAFNPNGNLSLRQQSMLLPIYQSKERILYALETYRTVIIVGETGSGKTTQLPQYLYDAGWAAGDYSIVCTQPRRVAATTVALRVAEEMGCDIGTRVGYAVRFDDRCDPERTRIKYVTDGMLLRETLLDPLLLKYSVIMIDEAHERSLNTDIILGLLKKIQRKRPDLRIIISSATLEATPFKDFFETNGSKDRNKDTACILKVEGRQHAVETLFVKEPVANYIDAAVDTVYHIHSLEKSGDVLVFLSGQDEIHELSRRLNSSGSGNLLIVPLYASLPPEKQLAAFKPTPRGVRKVVIATNLAETSVTIPGIVFVVDAGYSKVPSYSPVSGMQKLLIAPISRASARQRAGRAGRTQGGKCFHLFTEDDYWNVLPEKTVPEMQRSNLALVILQLKALGIHDIAGFPFLSPPPRVLLVNGVDLLYALGALDDDGHLTNDIGAVMAEFPVEPKLSKMLLASAKLGCAEEALTIAAMLSIDSPFVESRNYRSKFEAAKKKFSVHEGDHLTLLNVYSEFISNGKDAEWCKEHFIRYKALRRAVEIRKQLRRYLVRFKLPIESVARSHIDSDTQIAVLQKCILHGFFMNVAMLTTSGTYKSVNGNEELHIHPTSTLYNASPRWVLFHDLQLTTKRFMRDLTTVKPLWLSEVAPHFYDYRGVDVDQHSVVAATPASSSSPSPSSISQDLNSTTSIVDESGRKVKHRKLF